MTAGADVLRADCRTTRRLAMWGFPIVLWLVATFGLGGALGKSTDDYSTNLRDPVTNTLACGFRPFAEYSYFWRPAHIWLIHALQSYWYEHDRLIHALSAMMHAVVALLLFVLVRRVSRSSIAAGAAGIGFLVLPVHHEALYFTSTISTMIAAALLLWLAIAVARDAQCASDRRRRWHVAAMGVIALAIPYFYEQAGAGVVALPLLWLACANQPTRRLPPRAFARPLAITAIAAAMQGAMLLALLLTAPRGRRGSSTSIRPVGDWPEAWASASARLIDLLVGTRARSVMRGGLTLARDAVESSVLWVWLVPLAITATAFVLAVWRGVDTASPDRRAGMRAGLLLAAFGAVAAAATMLPPAVVTGQGVPPRLAYVPSLGLAVAFGGVLAIVIAAVGPRSRRVLVSLGAPVLAAAAIEGALALMGVQAWYQSRARTDLTIAEQLRRLMPDPPPQTIFVPIRIEHSTTRTGDVLFDRLRHGAFETIWSSTALTRQTYRRRDLWAAGWNPWRQPVIDQPTDVGVRLNDRFVIWSPFHPAERGGTAVPWTNLVPFSVDDRARVRLVRQLLVNAPDQPRRAIDIPIVVASLRQGQLRRGQTEVAELPGLKRVQPASRATSDRNPR